MVLEKKYFSGQIVDALNKVVYPGQVVVEGSRIVDIHRLSSSPDRFILPGFVDSHIHIESSMLTPQHFAEIALRHGTVATVSDPHEIANVLGLKGVKFMLENSASAPLKFYFGAPSCVPATKFETSGAKISALEIEKLFTEDKLHFLTEVMNYPGVIANDEDIMGKIQVAKKYNKRIDGHGPGLKGDDLSKYIESGIETDHEFLNYDEALEKVKKGMIIQIREGSAAKNFESLYALIDQYPDRVMLCTDDLHPQDLLKGHINLLLERGVKKGLNVFNLINAATRNPVTHYNLNVGLLKTGDLADFVIVKDLNGFEVLSTIINGTDYFSDNIVHYKAGQQKCPNKFYVNIPRKEDFVIPDQEDEIRIIQALDGELVTKTKIGRLKASVGELVSDIESDILKIVVQNRYEKEKPALGFISGFGIQKGAIASSISHDSHNIIAVSTDDDYLIAVIDWINRNKGGIAYHDGTDIIGLPLKVAGIISEFDAWYTADKYNKLENAVKNAGCQMNAPFMTLSFMALLVIPELKISNKGLFDVNAFKFTSLYASK